jgi:DNA-binding CsgD family transcriptional regulator
MDRRRSRLSVALGAELERAPGHLQLLYKTSKLLARFESVERTLPAVFSQASAPLRLSATVLIDGGEGRLSTFIWHAPGSTEIELRRAQRVARSSFDYLAGGVPGKTEDRAVTSTLEAMRSDGASGPQSRSRVTLPLVVDMHPVFGVLHATCHRSLDDVDLALLNALTNQIAVAVERHQSREDEHGSWVAKAVARLGTRYGITPAENRVAEYSVRGLSNKEIGRKLGVALSTVRSQLMSVCRKLGVDSRGLLAYRVCCESHRALAPSRALRAAAPSSRPRGRSHETDGRDVIPTALIPGEGEASVPLDGPGRDVRV